MLKSPLLLLTYLCLAAGVWGQEQPGQLPQIFVLGEYETAHMQVDSEYTQSLLTVSNQDLVTAQRSWLAFLSSMEDYAHKTRFPLDGVKLYLHVYCDASGAITHLGFLPLANSRPLPRKALLAFFSSFTRNNDFPQSPGQPFKYNSKVNFPVFSHLADRGQQ